MKTTIFALVLLTGCGPEAAVVSATGQAADSGVVADAGSPPPTDAGAPAVDSGTPDAGAPDACPLSPHWARDWPLPVQGHPTFLFHSAQPGDLWLESFDDVRNYAQLYHRAAAGTWTQMFGAFVHATTSMWVRSATEAWILEGNTVHVVGAKPKTLQLPNDRYYSAIGDGWISYFQPGQTLPAGCNPFTTNPGVVGFLRLTDSGLVDLPMPALCSVSLPDDIYMGTAVSMIGAVFSWDGSMWNPMASQFGGGGFNSYGVISGTASDDLYIVGAMQTQHFDGTAWKPFSFHPIDVNDSGAPRSVWAVSWGGPRWGASTTNAFQFSGGDWQDRGPLPGSRCAIAGGAAIGSDGTDVFVTGEWVQQPPASPQYSIWIYRYSP